MNKSLVSLSDYTNFNTRSFFAKKLVTQAEKVFKINQINTLYNSSLSDYSSKSFSTRIIEQLNIKVKLNNLPTDIHNIKGPTIFVSNHPFGALDGIIVTSILEKIRPDFKILANHLLDQVPELKNYFIFVDPFIKKSTSNSKGLKDALKWLRNGNALVIFPAGEVSHYQTTQNRISDSKWTSHVAKLALKTNSNVVPLYFDGKNSLLFQIAGIIHPNIRTTLLARELINKQNRDINIYFSKTISSKIIKQFSSPDELTSYIRLKTYMAKSYFSKNDNIKKSDSVLTISAISKNYLFAEIENLKRTDALLIEEKDNLVFCASADQIPQILKEIGRLREITFRAVGEGTNKAVDIDSYDTYYKHLFIWNKKNEEVVGAYRLGEVDKILKPYGKTALYTRSLFKYNKKFLKSIDPALELGRSFIQEKYQQKHNSLLLLWKGICQYIFLNPQYKYLFGPVSISDSYDSVSKNLITTLIKDKNIKSIKANNGIKSFKSKEFKQFVKSYKFKSIDDLSLIISSFENDEKKIPILLKQYLKLGGKILCYNIDPKFNNSIDGLILVEIRKIPKKLLSIYMGKNKAIQYLKSH